MFSVVLAGTHLTALASPLSEAWLSSMDPAARLRFRDHLSTVAETISKGVYSGYARASIGMWHQCLTFCAELNIDPFIQAFEDNIPVLQVFIHRVRSSELAANGGKI